MRIWSLPDLQVLELLLKLKVQQLTGFSWLVLSHGSYGTGSALPRAVVLLAVTPHILLRAA